MYCITKEKNNLSYYFFSVFLQTNLREEQILVFVIACKNSDFFKKLTLKQQPKYAEQYKTLK